MLFTHIAQVFRASEFDGLVNVNAQRIRFITILLTYLVWMVFVGISRGAWLEWDYNPPSQGVTNYRVWVGTNSGNYGTNYDVGNTNLFQISRLTLPRGKTNFFAVTAYNGFGESDLSEEVFTNWTSAAVSPITNVTLRVPTGKFYVERADTTAAWLSLNVVTGPTNIAFPITGLMGFYRYRPYFLSFSNPKGGATKLMVAKQPMFKRKPAQVVEVQPARIVQPNLDPSKR